MSFPVYKDMNASVRDALEEGFPSDHSLTVNASTHGVALNTTTTLCCGASCLPAKMSASWAHPSGFKVDSLEFSSCDDVTVSTSLSGAVPGADFSYAGDLGSKSHVLGAVFKHKLATVAADVDVSGFSTINASAVTGGKGVTAGGSVALSGGFDLKNFSFGVGWSNDTISAGLQANDQMTTFNHTVQVKLRPNLTLSALVDYTPKADSPMGATVGAEFCCGKVKVNHAGDINAAFKHQLDPNFTVVAAAGANVKDLKSIAFGVTATVG